jgi:hypothetical protein
MVAQWLAKDDFVGIVPTIGERILRCGTLVFHRGKAAEDGVGHEYLEVKG